MSSFVPAMLLFVAALAILFRRAIHGGRSGTFVVAITVVFSAMLFVVFSGSRTIHQFEFSPLADYAALLVLGSLLVSLCFSQSHLDTTEPGVGEWAFFLLSSAVGLLAVVYTFNLIIFLIGLELALIPAYFLTIYRSDAVGYEAGLKFFIATLLGSVFLLFSLLLFYAGAETLNLNALEPQSGQVLLFSVLLLVLGVALKLGLGPFYFWWVDVLEGATLPASLYLATAYRTSLVFFLVKLVLQFQGQIPVAWSHLLLFLATISLVVGGLLILVQNNLRRLLAWTTVIQLGFFALCLASGSSFAVTVGIFYWTVSILGLFGAYCLLLFFGQPDKSPSLSLDRLSEVTACNSSAVFFGFFVFLTLAGLPPLAGFVAKLMLLTALLRAGFYWVFLGGIVVLLSVSYTYFRLIYRLFVEPRAPGRETGELVFEQNLFSVSVGFAAVVAVLISGIYPPLLYNYLTALVS